MKNKNLWVSVGVITGVSIAMLGVIGVPEIINAGDGEWFVGAYLGACCFVCFQMYLMVTRIWGEGVPTMTREEIMGLDGRELEITVGREVMGFLVYNYSKDYRYNYLLRDREQNPVATPRVIDDVLDRGLRGTEAEAWNDTPCYIGNSAAFLDFLEEISRQGLNETYDCMLRQIEHFSPPSECGEWTYSSLKYSPAECLRAALMVVLLSVSKTGKRLENH